MLPGEDDRVSDAMAAILRAKTPAERLAIANGMWKFARGLVEWSERAAHPGASEEEIRRRVATRMSHGAV